MGLDWGIVLCLGFYCVLSFALMRSMVIDTYGLEQTRLDLMAYWICLLISALLAVWLLSQRKLQSTFFLTSFLIFYITLIVKLTAPEISLTAFLISRYGILFWFLLGVGAGAVFDILQQRRVQGRMRRTKIGFIFISGGLGALMVEFARQYLAFPVQTVSYQSVANSLAIFLIMTVCVIEVLWGKHKSILFSFGYLVIGTIVVATVVRMQSNSIVGIWVGIIFIFYRGLFWNSRLIAKVALFAALIGGGVYFYHTELFEDIMANTRLSVFAEGGRASEFSSWMSRLEIADTFLDQFAVSPVLGDFRAEMVAGAGVGEYCHSILLSFLTHTGIIGTTLFFAIVILLLKRRLVSDPSMDPSEKQIAGLMMVVLALGTISTFMTWSVLWFMMGVLCRRPARNLARY